MSKPRAPHPMSKTSIERYYLTTPIYYVNARPHLGHAYSTIVCDAIARRKRALGIETWFLTGTDEHGQKIERSAEKAGRTPQEFADALSAEFRGLWDKFDLSYDDYIRTTSERHKRGVQKLFATLRDRGYIYKGSYTGQYCVSDEAYVEGPAGTICPDCGRLTETVSEENYFFKLSAFENRLLKFYEENPGFIAPESTKREVISFVRGGLKDLSVSRTTFQWGIPVPGDEKHVVYVWLDALANYMTALGYGSENVQDQEKFKKFWPADVHLIGKEISRFHCVYWPAFLMAAGLPTPKSVRANGWLMFDQSKMSKSKGNIVRAETVHAVLGADALRYYLLREIPFGQDGNFSFDALVQRYNADLANGYGNLVSRVVNMMHKYFGGVVPAAGALTEAEIALQASAERTLAAFGPAFDAFDFAEALKSIWTLVADTDGYLTANAPWKKPAERSDEEHTALQARVLATAAEAIRVITALVYPILPASAAKVWLQIGQGEISEASNTAFLTNVAWGGLKPGTTFAEPAPLFPRADKDAVARMVALEEEDNRSAVESATAAPSTESTLAATTSKSEKKIEKKMENTPVVPTPEVLSAVGQKLAPPQVAQAAEGQLAPPQVPLTPADLLAVTPEAPAVQVLPEGFPPAAPQITIGDVLKVDLRVAQVLVAERIPKADKLLRLEVDLGYEKRQILAGIAQYYEPEQLVGRKIVIVANLAPRKLRGLESNGMLLAASLENSSPVLAGFLEDVPLGARLK
ncbi:methionine--tRNA ligase [Telmatobacter bradus]|uniref:methionine--tRNA ligase n=1 Tax=Telmatobacter bradus TaxID=474953 RepID=UPI003B4330AA